MTEKQKNLLFIAIILALAAVLWLAAHHGGTGRTAVLRYGDPQVEQRIDLRKNAEYDIDTGLYTIHLRVENGGIALCRQSLPRPPVRGLRHPEKRGRLGRVHAGEGKFDDRIRKNKR